MAEPVGFELYSATQKYALPGGCPSNPPDFR